MITAPKSVDPATGRPYGSHYPWPTIEDMVHCEKRLLDHLGPGEVNHTIEQIAARAIDPYSAAKQLLP